VFRRWLYDYDVERDAMAAMSEGETSLRA